MGISDMQFEYCHSRKYHEEKRQNIQRNGCKELDCRLPLVNISQSLLVGTVKKQGCDKYRDTCDVPSNAIYMKLLEQVFFGLADFVSNTTFPLSLVETFTSLSFSMNHDLLMTK